MQDLKDLNTTGFDTLSNTVAANLMSTLKARLVTEIERGLANQTIVGGYKLALAIGQQAIHTADDWRDPMPGLNRHFNDAENLIAAAVREAAVIIARAQLEAISAR